MPWRRSHSSRLCPQLCHPSLAAFAFGCGYCDLAEHCRGTSLASMLNLCTFNGKICCSLPTKAAGYVPFQWQNVGNSAALISTDPSSKVRPRGGLVYRTELLLSRLRRMRTKHLRRLEVPCTSSPADYFIVLKLAAADGMVTLFKCNVPRPPISPDQDARVRIHYTAILGDRLKFLPCP